jgi:hypothetical protein
VIPQIRLLIDNRLSWLCKLEFLGKIESTYTCLGNKKNIQRTKGVRDHISRAMFPK